jgi:hypothetical protein
MKVNMEGLLLSISGIHLICVLPAGKGMLHWCEDIYMILCDEVASKGIQIDGG